MHSHPYGAPRGAACEELSPVQCTEAGIERLKYVIISTSHL